jgi:hypothetical protein
MERGKGSKILSKSLHKIYSNYTKYNSLAKLRIDNIKNTSSKQNITLKSPYINPIQQSKPKITKEKAKLLAKKIIYLKPLCSEIRINRNRKLRTALLAVQLKKIRED